MVATHPDYTLMKIPGSSGVLTVAGDTKDALQALKLIFRTARPTQPSDKGGPEAPGATPAKNK